MLDDRSDQDDVQQPVAIKSLGTGKICLNHKNYLSNEIFKEQLAKNSISSTSWNSNILKNNLNRIIKITYFFLFLYMFY